jgi:hypothetical protein
VTGGGGGLSERAGEIAFIHCLLSNVKVGGGSRAQHLTTLNPWNHGGGGGLTTDMAEWLGRLWKV